MAGLVPAIPLRWTPYVPKRDARHKAGHDGERFTQSKRKMLYRRRMTAASSHEMARYITDDTIAKMVIPVMTMFILNI